ncbi:MAG TPA: ABC transporter ATP-binding protein [Dongiaceae bacterium]|jgi:ABC-type nitrate/sulfonate/bicarbonate transport system ATPase subunit|nr:ABC transporter ATP-binding protein [Dongiaceae bacterium]
MTGLVLSGITRDFAEPTSRHVLRGVELSIAQGEFVSMVGPSGSGKTTLLRIIAGLDPSYTGRVMWQAGRRPRLGVVFQEPRLVPWLSILDNLLLVTGPEAIDRARALLAEVELADSEDALPGQLSGGMQRRAALARALLVQPDFLLLDEPLISLDAALADRMRDLLNRYWREHRTTTLLVTHNLSEASDLSTRVLILSPNEGRLVADCALPSPDPRLRNDRAVSAVLEELRRLTNAWPRADSPEVLSRAG